MLILFKDVNFYFTPGALKSGSVNIKYDNRIGQEKDMFWRKLHCVGDNV